MNAKTKPFRYNVGEAIIEPFWDPSVSGLNDWQLADIGARGVKVTQYWCYVPYEWLRTAPDGTGVKLVREYEDLCVEGYDALVLSAAVPENGFLQLTAVTDQGVKSAREDGAGKRELMLPLEGAEHITEIVIEVGNTTGESATGWINWLGAQNTRLLNEYLSLKRQYDERWEGFLADESYEPKFEPEYGLIATKEELALLRSRYEEHIRNGGTDVFYENIRPYLEKKPEDMIADYVRLTDDIRYCRVRDEGQYTANGVGEKLVQYALLKKDKKILRLAARYCLSLLMTTYWLDGFIANYPPGLWEHSGFVPSMALSDMAAVLDGAGELFTDKAKKMIKKQMMEKGLSKVNSVVWRYDSIFHCNQLAWYSYGRMYAYALLSLDYERIAPYMELARKDIETSMGLAIGADGAADEGVSYFLCQPGHAGAGLFWYARAAGKKFDECLPKELFRTADYIDALSSTCKESAFLPVCDFSEPHDIRGIAIMAYAMPKSLWVNVYHKKKRELGGIPNDFISLMLDEKIPSKDNPAKCFVRLPESGYVSSVRRDDTSCVKVFVMGGKAGAGHNHEDKGSYIVEYNGEVFLADPGMVSYGNAQSRALKMCDYHNMLLPEGCAQNPHPKNPLPYSYSADGEGDERKLHLSMDLTASFDEYYSLWRRELSSEEPSVLTVADTYELKQGSGVVSLLNTWYPVREEDGMITIEGRESVCTFRLPQGVRLEETLRTVRGETLHQLGLHLKGTAGEMILNFRFEPKHI